MIIIIEEEKRTSKKKTHNKTETPFANEGQPTTITERSEVR
jgi:hypothetical protein